jgi:hypothetical protein
MLTGEIAVIGLLCIVVRKGALSTSQLPRLLMKRPSASGSSEASTLVCLMERKLKLPLIE